MNDVELCIPFLIDLAKKIEEIDGVIEVDALDYDPGNVIMIEYKGRIFQLTVIEKVEDL